MKLKFVFLIAISTLGFVGCSSTPTPKASAVDVAGIVMLPDGKPVQNVTIIFLATSGEQAQGSFALKADGKFDVKLIPGKYTIVFEGSGLKAIPAKYHLNNPENSVEIPEAGNKSLEIKLTN